MSESPPRAGCHAADACECCDAWRHAVREAAQALRAEEESWVDLGRVGTDVATIAIVCPLYSGALSRWWDGYLVGGHLQAERATHPAYRELVLSTSWSWGPDGPTGPFRSEASAVLFDVDSNGAYDVQGRFEDLYGDGRLALVEVRVLLHEDQDDDEDEAGEP